KGDVRPRADRRVDIGHRAGARETRVDVNDLGAVLDLRFHRPAEGDGVVFRHVGAHDDDAIGVGHAPRVEGSFAAAESGPQTGDARAVSYPRLTLDRHNTQSPHQLRLDAPEF